MLSVNRNRPWLICVAVGGIIAPILFTALILAGSLITPGYNQFSQTISELGQVGQSYALLQDANFVLTGLLIIGLLIGLSMTFARSPVSTIGPILILAYPVAFVLVGTIIPLPSQFHVPVGSVAFFVTLLGMISLAFTMRRDVSWQHFASLTMTLGFLSVIGFFVYGFLQSQGLLTNWLGLLQRFDLAPFFVWIEIVAVRLYRVSKKHLTQTIS